MQYRSSYDMHKAIAAAMFRVAIIQNGKRYVVLRWSEAEKRTLRTKPMELSAAKRKRWAMRIHEALRILDITDADALIDDALKDTGNWRMVVRKIVRNR